jgi:preprotein translocase subunit SecD
MNVLTKALVLGALAGCGSPAVAAEPPAKEKAKVEFRRAEAEPAEGLTEAKVAGTDQKVYLHKAADLTGADVASAVVGGDDDKATVQVTLTGEGTKKAAKLSKDHANKPLAIVVDGKVIAAPVIRAELGESVVITGNFTKAEAEKIVAGLGK